MTRICGWMGGDAPPDRRRAMLEAMAGIDESALRSRGAFWTEAGCGLAVVPGAAPVDFAREADLWVAVEGAVRFDDPHLAGVARERGAATALAQGYRERGARVLEHTRDAFALAILAPASSAALLAIDRIGGRHPLTYRLADGALIFGSDPGAVHGHPLGRAEIDPQAIYNYLYFHMVPGPGTIRRGTRRLMPGERLDFSAGSGRVERYWRIEYLEHEKTPLAALEAELHRLLRQSIAHDLVDGVGCFLSGGTDSSTVVGVVGELSGERPRAYTIGFDAPGYDEMVYARTAAQHFGAKLHEYYLRPADVVDGIPRIAAAHAEPFGNASAVPAYYCAKMAREDGVRRMLAGDGGDELFAGNTRYVTQAVFGLWERVPSWLRDGIIGPVAFRFPAGERIPPVRKARSYITQARVPMPQRTQTYNYLERLGVARIFEPAFLEQVDTGVPISLLAETWDGAAAESMVTRMLVLDHRFTLADSDLPKVSRSCELAGMDVTYPLLSDAIVDFSRRVPPGLNVRHFQLRWFWKHALRDFLPQKVLKKSKHGFGLPFGEWMRDDRQLGELAHESIRSFARRGIVRADFIEETLRLHRSEHARYYGVMIWLLVMLEQWFRAHVDATTRAHQGSPA